MYLTEDEILGANDLPEADVLIPEWPDKHGQPGRVRVRSISKLTQQHIRNLSRDADGSVNADKVEMAMVLACVVQPVLSEKNIEAFKAKRASAWDRITRKVAELNGSVTPVGEVPAETSFLSSPEKQKGDGGNLGQDSNVSANGIAA